MKKIELLLGIYKQNSQSKSMQIKLKEAKHKLKEIEEAVLVNQEEEVQII